MPPRRRSTIEAVTNENNRMLMELTERFAVLEKVLLMQPKLVTAYIEAMQTLRRDMNTVLKNVYRK